MNAGELDSELHDAAVHVWYRRTDSLDPDEVAATDQYLSSDERERRDRFRFETDRRDFAAAHDLLRRALSRYEDVPPAAWRFTREEGGKPSIESDDRRIRALTFSLSHARGCVACAVARGAEVGVDVERTDRSVDASQLASRYFSEEEAAFLRRCPHEVRSQRFAELWTLKEAWLKAMGVGLSGSLADVSFRFDDESGIEPVVASTGGLDGWQVVLFEPDDHVRLAVAVHSRAHPRFTVRRDGSEDHVLAPIRASGCTPSGARHD